MTLHLRNLLSYVVSSKNLMNKDHELFIVTNFGKVVGTKEQVKELVKVIKAGSSCGAFGSTKRQSELSDISKNN